MHFSLDALERVVRVGCDRYWSVRCHPPSNVIRSPHPDLPRIVQNMKRLRWKWIRYGLAGPSEQAELIDLLCSETAAGC